MPPEIPPFPSALKEPTRAKNSPVAVSVPLMEKAKRPLRLEFEKPPVGGGGVGTEPLPPQATVKTATYSVTMSARRFIVHRPSDRSEHLLEGLCWLEPQQGKAEDRDLSEQPRVECRPARGGQRR